MDYFFFHQPMRIAYFCLLIFIPIITTRRIADPERNGYFNITSGDDFEYKDPETKIHEMLLFNFMSVRRTEAYAQVPPPLRERMTAEIEKQIMMAVMKKAHQDATEIIDELKAVKLPEELLSILSGLKKKEEEKIFSALQMTSEMLQAFMLHAGTLGYTYSWYTFVFNPTGTDESNMPRFAYKDDEDGSIFKTDDTNMSDGQVKSLIDQTKTVMVKMLDKGDQWHCFFYTMKGVSGKEKDHPPHMHYLSSTWGVTREQVLEGLKKKWYGVPTVHVWFDRR